LITNLINIILQDNHHQADDKLTNSNQSPKTSAASNHNNEDSDMPEIKIEFDKDANLVTYEHNIQGTSSAEIKIELQAKETKSPDPINTSEETISVYGDEIAEVVTQTPDKVDDYQTSDPYYCDICSIDFATIAYYNRHLKTNKHTRALNMARRGRKFNQKVKYVRKNPVKLPQKSTVKNPPVIKQKQAEKHPEKITTNKASVTEHPAAEMDNQNDQVVPQMPTTSQSYSGMETFSKSGNVYEVKPVEEHPQNLSIEKQSENLTVPSTSSQRLEMQPQNLTSSSTSSQHPQMQLQTSCLPSTSSQQPLMLPHFPQMVTPSSTSSQRQLVFNPILHETLRMLVASFQHLSRKSLPSSQIQQQIAIPQVPIPKLYCNFCNKSFNLRAHLTQHINAAHTERNFRCQLCGKKFLSMELLEAHEWNHRENKPYKCTVCPKSYITKIDLKRHEESHEAVKKYTCYFCGVGFVRRDHLVRHMETHRKKKDS